MDSKTTLLFDMELLLWLADVSEKAGEQIMAFYQGDKGVELKADQSPITLADRAAHRFINRALLDRFPAIPVISEEGELPDYGTRKTFQKFWLVDPLDGTKEFIKRNGDFTVNIALIVENQPTVGVVHAPTKGMTYVGLKGKGAWLRLKDQPLVRLQTEYQDGAALRVAVSRSHPNEALSAFLNRLPNAQTLAVGSSLKFCKIADNNIDLYPRFGPLHEWDTAAAHVVAVEAGGVVSDIYGEPLGYNKEVMKHQNLLVASNSNLAAHIVNLVKQSKEQS